MRVTIKTIAGLTSLAGLLIGNSVFAANLILNPGFETGDLTDWSVLGASGGSAYVNVLSPNNGPSATGTYDAYMYNVIPAANLALQQSTALGDASPGLVNYSLDLKVDSSLNGGVVFIHFWDINATGGVIDQGPGLKGPYFNTGWTTLTGSWTAPAGVNHFEIEIDCTTGATSGSTEAIEVDNVSLTQVPEPATLSLAALGLLGAWTFRRSRKA
ncbi:MAG TPA: PEP-CTERM sorting domain-containing protein [Candidatus Limnocylindrales bacterium]|nr:PEP-CTERM sorting domain-containing protein [Candidatus Limnocylindrales bacterium]